MQQPKEIDFEVEGGVAEGKKILGIYILNGNELTLILAIPIDADSSYSASNPYFLQTPIMCLFISWGSGNRLSPCFITSVSALYSTTSPATLMMSRPRSCGFPEGSHVAFRSANSF